MSLRPCGPLALIPVNEKKTKSEAKFRKKWLQRATLGSPCGDPSKLKVVFQYIIQATQQVFYVIRLSTRENSDRKNLTPKRHHKQNGLLWGFPVLSPVQSSD
jgi:hypothetical protein